MVFSVINDKTFCNYVPEKIFLNRTSRSKVMTIFQFICQYYAIACNTCNVHAYFLFVVSIVHSYLCQFLKV